MTSLSQAPKSVRAWFEAEASTDPEPALRALLAQDVIFDFGGHKMQGVDAAIGAIGFMIPPGWLGPVEWSLQPIAADGRVTVRGVAPGGAHLPSPGGPMSAIDYVFTLGADGLITRLAPQPYHLEPSGHRPALRIGETAPDFTLPDVEGVPVSLRAPGASATVVIFTCNHCPFSLAWHERVQNAARDYAPRGVRVLQINPNDPAVNPRDGLEPSRKRVANGEFAGPYLMDEGQKAARQWGARHTPEVFVLDASGVLKFHGAPDADVSDDAQNAAWLRGALDAVLAGLPANPAETKLEGCSIKWTMG